METILPSASPVPVPVASPSPFHLVPSNAVDLEPHPDNVPYGISWTVMRNLGFDVGYALGVASTVEDYSGMASEMVGIVISLARRGHDLRSTARLMGIPIAGLRGFIAGAAEHGKPVNLIWTETQSA